jgi:hypothetical protein
LLRGGNHPPRAESAGRDSPFALRRRLYPSAPPHVAIGMGGSSVGPRGGASVAKRLDVDPNEFRARLEADVQRRRQEARSRCAGKGSAA